MFHRVLKLLVLLGVFVVTASWTIDVGVARSQSAAMMLLLFGGLVIGVMVVGKVPVVQRRLPAIIANIPVTRILNYRVLIQLLCLSLLQQFALTFFVGSIAYGLSISVALPVLITMVSLSLLAVVLPISVNGLGVRDSVFVQVLAVSKVPASSAVALSLSVFLIGFLFSLLSMLYVARAEMK
jgi:hypothetical protein